MIDPPWGHFSPMFLCWFCGHWTRTLSPRIVARRLYLVCERSAYAIDWLSRN